jgi:ABC-type protease/lipase transport system fused ATPase/permease subunit
MQAEDRLVPSGGRGFSPLAFLLILGLLSVALNLLMLASPVIFIQLYDRVITSHNIHLLVVLLGVVAGTQVLHGLLRFVRIRFARRYASILEETWGPAAFSRSSSAAAAGDRSGTPVRDLDRIRSFVVSEGLAGLFDLPWVIVFVGFMALLHPSLGALGLAFTLIIVLLGVLEQWLSRAARNTATPAETYHRAILRTGGLPRAFGLTARFAERWIEARRTAGRARERAQSVPDLIRAARQTAKSLHAVAMLGVAAYLTLRNVTTFGVLIACLILARRITEPVDAVINNWRDIRAARLAWSRLNRMSPAISPSLSATTPWQPNGQLELDGVSAGPPGTDKAVLTQLSFTVWPGEVVGIMGRNGVGKSTLANTLAGCWPAKSGRILLDDKDYLALSERERASIVGYLPQKVQFFCKTIADDVSHLSTGDDEASVLKAIELAGAKDFVTKLESGIHTPVSKFEERGTPGDRQKLALARAIYRNPFLLILDDPSVHLDRDGERRLGDIIAAQRARNGITIILSDHAPLMRCADRILVLRNGVIAGCGAPELASFESARRVGHG